MFSALCLKDGNSGAELWKCTSPNADFSQRPLLLLLGKESIDNLQHLHGIEKEQKKMEHEGVVILAKAVL